jgi:hypothetical protein
MAKVNWKGILSDFLQAGAEAVAPKEDTRDAGERAVRSVIAGAADFMKDEINTPHCVARTRRSMGHDLACGKKATKVKDGKVYCRACAPADAIDIEVRNGSAP